MARIAATLTVKGTRHYDASRLLTTGTLVPGLSVLLEHEPKNEHDRNAVVVLAGTTRKVLGHVSRDVARKYARLAKAKRIREATVSNVSGDGDEIRIKIRVVYEEPDSVLARRAGSTLVQSAACLPSSPGVYAIRNLDSGKKYIGSSANMKERVSGHITALSSGSHANPILQADVSQLGFDDFEAEVLVPCVPLSRLLAEEERQIKSHIESGETLYNLTPDGRGRAAAKWYQSSATESVTDRLAARPPIEAPPVKGSPVADAATASSRPFFGTYIRIVLVQAISAIRSFIGKES